MDSLTQIALGAAVGEVVLGKKIGNRAMMWGAVAGTIPDLDVIAGSFLSNIDNLAFHRGISHSILFCVLGAFVFGWLVHQLYQSPYHKYLAILFKSLAAILIGFAMNFIFSRLVPGNYIPLIISILLIGLVWFFNLKRSYFSDNWEKPEASVRNWQWLFFWSLITHPLLDCFTMYGTQVFTPFWDYRVSWATISVADPIYTLPFLFCVIAASRFARNTSQRNTWNYLGLVLSSLYMTFTVINKQYVNSVFKKSLVAQNIPYERFKTGPIIFNNIAWTSVAETKEAFYLANYSLFDEVAVKWNKVPKNHELINNIETDLTVQTLKWFSDGYFNAIQIGDTVQINDLRFSTFSSGENLPEDYIFKFKLTTKGNGNYYLEKGTDGPPKGKGKEILPNVWKRIKGLKN